MAQYHLVNIYNSGDGVPVDYKKAFYYYKLASE